MARRADGSLTLPLLRPDCACGIASEHKVIEIAQLASTVGRALAERGELDDIKTLTLLLNCKHRPRPRLTYKISWFASTPNAAGQSYRRTIDSHALISAAGLGGLNR
jgi:hypothetical protein